MSFIGVRFEVGEGVKLTVYFAEIQHFLAKIIPLLKVEVGGLKFISRIHVARNYIS